MPIRPLPDPGRDAPRWQLRLLGGFELRRGDAVLYKLPARAVTALLARLALQPDRVHGRDELAELLWPGADAATGRNRLRQVLSTLRSVLDDSQALRADRIGVRLGAAVLACDARAFEQAWAAGRHAEAAALYRGELLPGFTDDWLHEERLRLQALRDRLDDPPPVPAAAAAARLVSLPHYLTRLIGADQRAARLAAELQGRRLVTLTGPGGSGKTRLAIEAARLLAQAPGFAAFDLLQFVPLVSCDSAAQMLDRLLLSLQLGSSAAAPLERLVNALKGRRCLLLLDNFEQLVDSTATQTVAQLLEQLPELHLLVSSRRLLGLDGEHAVPLAPLGLPSRSLSLDQLAQNPSVALFIDRARAVRPDFTLDEANADALVELVQMLEGLPLAIELAAARMRSLAPATVLELLQTGLASHQLDLLSRSGPRGGSDARHASMLGVVDWSWQLLPAPQRELLAALAVFHGGCTVEAAHAVAAPDQARAALLLTLDALVANSVVQVRVDASIGAARYQPFEPVREHSELQLEPGRAQALRARLRGWLVAHGRALPATPPLAATRAELPNLLAGLASAVPDGAPDEALHIALAFEPALEELTLPASGLTALSQAVATSGDAGLAARAQAFLAEQCFEAGLGEQARSRAAAALAGPARNAAERAAIVHAAARVTLRTEGERPGTAARVQLLIDEALPLARATDTPAGADTLARLLVLQGVARVRAHSDYRGAEALMREALALWQRSGRRLRQNSCRTSIAINLGFQRRLAEQIALLDEVEAEARALGQHRQLAFARSVRGYALADLRRWPESLASYQGCLEGAFESMNLRELFYGLWNVPRTLAHLRRPADAARVMGFAEHFYAERFGTLGAEDLPERRRSERLVRAQLGSAATAVLWQEGRQLPLRLAVRLAAT